VGNDPNGDTGSKSRDTEGGSAPSRRAEIRALTLPMLKEFRLSRPLNADDGETPNENRSLRGAMFYPKADVALSDSQLRQLRQVVGEEGLRPTRGSFGRSVPTFFGGGATNCSSYPAVGHIPPESSDVVDQVGASWIVRTADGETPGLRPASWMPGLATICRRVACPPPRVNRVDLTRSQAPFDFAIVERAEGEPPRGRRTRRSGAPRGSCDHWAKSTRRLHAGSRVEGLSGLIAAADRSSPEIGRGSCSSWTDYLLGRLDNHVDRLSRDRPAISEQEAQQILQLFPHVLETTCPTSPRRLLPRRSR